MAGRHVKVGISGAPDPGADVNVSRVGVRERFLRWLFGPLQELTLIVPGRKIEDVTVTQRSTESSSGLDESGLELVSEAKRRHPAGAGLRVVDGGDVA